MNVKKVYTAQCKTDLPIGKAVFDLQAVSNGKQIYKKYFKASTRTVRASRLDTDITISESTQRELSGA